MTNDHHMQVNARTLAFLEWACVALALLVGIGSATTAFALSRDLAEPKCASTACLRPDQLVTWYTARRMKGESMRDLLLLDARSAGRVEPGLLVHAFDAHVPFVEFNGGDAGPGAMRFHADFTNRVDDIVRQRGMRASDRIIVLCDTAYCGSLAALLLQEHGYSELLVIVEGATIQAAGR
jgi:rhodanese-related sulfurtransferase